MNYDNTQTEYLINKLRDYSAQNYPGQAGDDIRVPKKLLRAVANRLESLSQQSDKGSNILGDKAYGTKAIRAYIDSQKAAYTIPPKSNANDPWPADWYNYKERHLVECFFQRLKWFRRVFTRYDKLDISFLAFVYVAAIAILLK